MYLVALRRGQLATVPSIMVGGIDVTAVIDNDTSLDLDLLVRIYYFAVF
jgi:hypothetical protein